MVMTYRRQTRQSRPHRCCSSDADAQNVNPDFEGALVGFMGDGMIFDRRAADDIDILWMAR